MIWSDTGGVGDNGSGIDPGTIDATDLILTGVSVTAAESLSGPGIADGTVRYRYDAPLPDGKVDVTFVEGAVRDLAGNESAAAADFFNIDRQGPTGSLVTPIAGSTVTVDSGYVDIDWSDVGIAGFDTTTLGIDDISVTGVSVDEIESRSGGIVRYWYDKDNETLPVGSINVALNPNGVADALGNPNQVANWSFTFQPTVVEPVDVSQLVDVQFFGIRYNRRTRSYLFFGTITNTSNSPLTGPIRLYWHDITPAGSVAVGASAAEDGTPYFDVTGAMGDERLDPGETSQSMPFEIRSTGPFHFDPVVTAVIADSSVPTLLNVARDEPLSESTNADVLAFHATFDRPVTDLSDIDLEVLGGSTAAVVELTPVEGVEGVEDHVYQVIVAGGDLASFNGSVGIGLTSTGETEIEIESAGLAASLASEPETMIGQSFIVDNNAPRLRDVETERDQNSVIRSITTRFDEPVIIDAGAFQLTNQDGIEVFVTHSSSIVDGRTEVTITFDGPLTDGSGSLVDGNYRLTTLDSHVRDAADNPLDGNHDGQAGSPAIDEFFRLFGDSDGDRDVDGRDYARFGMAFTSREGDSTFDPSFDFDGDGDVDGQDYGHFGNRFRRRLAP